MKNNKKCEICGNDINEYNYYEDEGRLKYFCSENCAKKAICDYELSNKISHNQICKAYDYCKQLNNTIKDRCKYSQEITKKSYTSITPQIDSHFQCQPSQISMIIGNMKLYEFVKQSEEESKKLNEESLKLNEDSKKTNEDTNHLTKIMLGVSFANLILILVQIYLTVV